MKKLIAVETAGMCDRLRLILACWKIAKEAGREFQFVWDVNGHCAASFDDLFETHEPVVSAIDLNPEVPVQDFVHMTWENVRKSILTCEDEVIRMHAYEPPYDPAEFDKHFMFSKQVFKTASEFGVNLLPRPVIGVHVRGVDYRPAMPPAESYFQAIRHINCQGKIFLATDEDTVIDKFEKEYGDRLVKYPVRSFERASREATIDGAIDLCLLRSCDWLVLSRYSTFSQLACRTQSFEKYTVGIVYNA